MGQLIELGIDARSSPIFCLINRSQFVIMGGYGVEQNDSVHFYDGESETIERHKKRGDNFFCQFGATQRDTYGNIVSLVCDRRRNASLIAFSPTELVARTILDIES